MSLYTAMMTMLTLVEGKPYTNSAVYTPMAQMSAEDYNAWINVPENAKNVSAGKITFWRSA